MRLVSKRKLNISWHADSIYKNNLGLKNIFFIPTFEAYFALLSLYSVI